jgi:CubicO group peptidase (beta-lactamase class C family)
MSSLQSIQYRVQQGINRRLNGFVAPENLDLISDIDPNEVRAENPAIVDELWTRMQAFYQTGMHPFVSLAIRHKGDLIFNRSIGYAQMDVGASCGEVIGNINTPVCLFSASKPISSMLVHKLVEQGLVNLLRPISDYLPAFGKNGKENITIYQMLTHRSGFAFIDQDIDPTIIVDLDGIFNLICDLPCADSDGRVVAYHGVTAGFVIAKLVQELTGKTIREYLDDEIRKPMGMTNFDYGYHGTADTPVAYNYNTGGPRFGLFIDHLTRTLGIPFEEIVELSNTALFHDGTVPSGNAYCTAEEASRFYQMLLDDGEYQGRQIFNAGTVGIAAQEAGPATFDRALCIPMRFSPAFMLGGKPVGMYGRDTHHAFGHLGLSNVITFADPQRDISVGLMTNGKPVIGSHLIEFLRLMNAIGSSFDAKDMG